MDLETVLSYVVRFWQSFQPVLYALIGLVALLVAIGLINRIVGRLRRSGAITRSAEGKFKLIIVLIGITLYLSYVFTLIKSEALWILAIIVGFSVGLIFYSIRHFFENLFTFIMISSSNVIREGERVIVRLGENEVEGHVVEMNESYVVIRTLHNALVYIPNTQLVKAVIVRPSQTTLRLKVTVRAGERETIDIDSITRAIESVITSCRLIDKSNIQVRPVEVYDGTLVVVIEADVLNPRNVDEAYTEIVNRLRTVLQHRVKIELID